MSFSGEQHNMEGKSLIQGKRPDSPQSSCVSMQSDCSMNAPLNYKEGDSSAEISLIQGKRPASPEPSCVSMRSDCSMNAPLNYREGDSSAEVSLIQGKRPASPEPSCVSMRSDCSMKAPLNYREGDSSAKVSLIQGKRPDSPEPSCVSMRSDCSVDAPQNYREGDSFAEVRTHKITPCVQRDIQQTDLYILQTKLLSEYHQKLKSRLRENFEKINEGIPQQGTSVLLNEIYTELYITEGGSGEVNNEHEVRQIETTSRRLASEDIPIQCNDLFRDKHIQTALTKGVAGIGKTVSVQKLILDWAKGEANQDILFIFPLPFRELNLMKERNLSLMELLHHFHPEIKELQSVDCDSYKVLFIYDGLDECRLPLDFKNNKNVSDVTHLASVDVLVTNLIKRNLLPSALHWITSRPAATNQIPSECVDQVTEIRGFSDPQKEEYFRKKISDQSYASKIITHMKSSRSLYIMCHIPVFCWLVATVLERVLHAAESGEVPKTLTQMFTHFLIFQTKNKDQKYHGKHGANPQQTKKSILALGKLAFQQLEKGNLIFYEEDLRECGIDVTEVSVYSGVCTQIFREELRLHLGKVFSFVHLSVQEYLAALYALISFTSRDVTKLTTDLSDMFKMPNMSDFLKNAVDMALLSENGHLDLFLRFLLGLSLDSNQTLLQDLLTLKESSSHSKEEIIKYIKEKIKENPAVEKSINLFHCLNELNDHSLVQEVQTYLNKEGYFRLSGAKLSPAQWSALVFVMLNSVSDEGNELDEFNLRKYDASDEGLLRLMPVVKACRNAVLRVCNLTEKSYALLASTLSSKSSNLRELNLSSNDLLDSGMKLLSAGLGNPHCKLEILRLCNCNIAEEGCAALASALKSNPSHLKMLNLNLNKPGESGVKLLSELLEDPRCTLEKLQLSNCNLTKKNCADLALILMSRLRDLDVSYNELQDSGIKLLSVGLENQKCKLASLGLCSCSITEKGCAALASALKSNPSHLRELNLNHNEPRDAGVKLLFSLLEDPHCKLETLQLCNCNLTEKSCAVLSSALSLNSSSLRELDLSNNNLQNSGVKLLSVALKNPHCKLEKVGLRDCKLTEASCADLASALSLNTLSLRDLDMGNNELQNSGVKLLSTGLKNRQCKLEKLGLYNCSIKDEGCTALASALKSNPFHLRELHLNYNKPGQTALELLSDLQKDPQCSLEKLQI
ncbi:NACHT, LRR and PYD domains-containing protein 3-like [Salminus brasiliensis]|uniref:NACHT, LRR and PYD domains-containing protein 3-like n=1 Tax=Salminus brasiliensis TaxID=930266 RepID=UPI003B832956